MAWVATEDFNSLTDGALATQGGGSGWLAAWVGDTDFLVQGTTTYEGAKAIECTNGNGKINRSITTGVSAGVVYFAIMRPDTTGDTGFGLTTGISDWCHGFMEVSNIEINHSGGSSNLLVGYTTNQWYVIRITINSTSSFNIAYSTGGSFVDNLGTLTSENTGNVDGFYWGCGGVGHGFYDDITPTNPVSTVTHYLPLMGVGT